MRPTIAALSLAALASVAVPAIAAIPAWTIDKAHSTLGFAGSMNGHSFKGTFRRWEGRIRFDAKDLAVSSILIVVDTGSAMTGDKTRDEALPTPDWFSVAAFPRATFEAHQFKNLGGGRFQAIGTLTVRGVKRPVILPFRLQTQGNRAHAVGALTLDRHLFGVGSGQFATADMVAFPVQVRFDLTAQTS